MDLFQVSPNWKNQVITDSASGMNAGPSAGSALVLNRTATDHFES
jgi:hypothetical protein